MEQDPVFKSLIQKSKVLRKYKDIQIPMVPKTPTILHHGVATVFLATINHILFYPLDCIKTRIMAKNKYSDVANYKLNRVSTLSLYRGFFIGFGTILIGNLCYLATQGKLLIGTFSETFFKTFMEMSKISAQMGNQKGNMPIIKQTIHICFLYGFLRDIIFRGLYLQSRRSIDKKKFHPKDKLTDQITKIIICIFGTTIITQPFDVCFTKVASQRKLNYKHLLGVPIKIYKEEGMGKLFSGLWPRLTLNIATILTLNSYYGSLIDVLLEAY